MFDFDPNRKCLLTEPSGYMVPLNEDLCECNSIYVAMELVR